MTRTLAISDTGLRLIKAFEGFRPDDRTLVTGTRVVGYGHRLEQDDDPVQMSRADAEEQLLDDLEPIEELVNDEVHAPLAQSQFDALCSLAFNIGTDAFRTSDIVRAMNNGRVLDAANGFDVWRKATVNGKTYVVDALMRRRTAEKSLFLRNEPAIPAPSAMLQPVQDRTAPLGPTDDGLLKVTADDGVGVIEAANIINADHVGAVAMPAAAVAAAAVMAAPVSAFDAADDILDDEDFGLLDEDLFEDPEADLSDDLDDDLDDDFEADDLSAAADEGDDDDDEFDDEDDYDDSDFNDDEDDLESDLDSDSDEDDIEITSPQRDDQTSDDDLESDDDGDDVNLDDVAGYDDETIEALLATDIIDEDDADRTDVSALISAAQTDLMGSDAEDDTQNDILDDVGEDVSSSTISDAATSLGDRLSALLDSDDTETSHNSEAALPASLLTPNAPDAQLNADPELVVDGADEGVRSNLVSFPKRELVLDADVVDTEVLAEIDTIDAATDGTVRSKGMVVIDDLAADDVLRASREPENPIYDPEGDPVENAMRYLERQASEQKAKKSNGGMWIPIALGAALVGASAVLIGRGATSMLSAWGPTAVTAAAITGGVTVLFAIYAVARGRSA